MKQRAPVRGHLRNRRGATLVLVAMLGVVLFMFVGIAIDFGRMYAFKSQLQTRADAAAMAGIVDVQNGITVGSCVFGDFVPYTKR